jgi:hypothetical protein
MGSYLTMVFFNVNNKSWRKSKNLTKQAVAEVAGIAAGRIISPGLSENRGLWVLAGTTAHIP